VEAAAELIVHASARHALECPIDDRANLLGWLIVPAMKEKRERRGVRKLGLAAEPAVSRIEAARHLRHRIIQQAG
jgi:hypothetical protein